MKKDYVALLRGINVGGNNIIRMADLRASFEKMGFEKVHSYIQSGNVLFSTDKSAQDLESKIEKNLSVAFGYNSTVVVVQGKFIDEVVKNAPKGFGSKPDEYKYDFIFLKRPLLAKEAINNISVRDGIDTAHVGNGVLYFSRLTAKLSQSHLSKIVKSPIYKQITIRNWNTTTKLLALSKKSLSS